MKKKILIFFIHYVQPNITIIKLTIFYFFSYFPKTKPRTNKHQQTLMCAYFQKGF